MFKLEKFIKGREKNSHYELFLRTFVKPVVGINTWNEKLKKPDTTPNNLFSKSDEAFAMIVLDNNYEYWSELFIENGNSIPSSNRKRKMNESNNGKDLTKKPKYTDSYLFNKKSSSGKQGKGWSEDGINKFNQYCRQCFEDRSNFPTLNKNFLKKEQERLFQKQNSKNVKKTKKVAVMPDRDSLFDDDDDEVLHEITMTRVENASSSTVPNNNNANNKTGEVDSDDSDIEEVINKDQEKSEEEKDEDDTDSELDEDFHVNYQTV